MTTSDQPAELPSAGGAIRFQAIVFKVATLTDGGWRLTLDGQGNRDALMALIDAKQPGILLEVAAVAVAPENFTKLDKNEIIEKKAKTSSTGVDRGRLVKQRD